MSINVFLSEELPENKDKVISIISFDKEVGYLNKTLSIGTPILNKKKLYEIWEVDDCVKSKNVNGINISKSKNYIFGYTVLEKSGSYEELKSKISGVYENFFKLSKENKMQIVKIWHYLPQLLKKHSNGKTNYSLLCEARENIYRQYYNDIEFPAATAIGIEGNKILIYFLASLCKTYDAIENERQVSAYNYPQNIFLEKPMFSRAIKFSSQGYTDKKIVISGTASIRGYKSMHEMEVIKQLDESIKNYKMFIEPDKNISNVSRVYLSKSQLFKYAEIIKILNKNFSENKYTLMQGELCRKELLVEIEGIANV